MNKVKALIATIAIAAGFNTAIAQQGSHCLPKFEYCVEQGINTPEGCQRWLERCIRDSNDNR